MDGADERNRLLAAIDDPELRRVAGLHLDGRSAEEIAVQVDCSLGTVRRKLQLIRTIWKREAGDGRG